MLAFGMKVACDQENGGVFSTSDYDGNRDSFPKSWWQQSEHLRALMHYAVLRGRSDLWGPYDKSLAFVKAHLIDAEYGGWFREFDPADPEKSKLGNKVGNYHTCGMYAEAVRLAKPAA